MRQNGLRASSFVAVVDVDPRVGDQLLDLLRFADVAAYSEPAPGRTGIYWDHEVSTRRLDRLWVDRDETLRARAVLDRALPHLQAELEIAIRDGFPMDGESRLAMSGDATRADGPERGGFGPGRDPLASPGVRREAASPAFLAGEAVRAGLSAAAEGAPGPVGREPAEIAVTDVFSGDGLPGDGALVAGSGTGSELPPAGRPGPEDGRSHPDGHRGTPGGDGVSVFGTGDAQAPAAGADPGRDEPDRHADGAVDGLVPDSAAVPSSEAVERAAELPSGAPAEFPRSDSRQPEGGRPEAGRAAGQLDDAAVEAAWAQIIADFNTGPDGPSPWPAAEDTLPARGARLRRPVRPGSAPTGPERDLLDIEHFVPPPPPELPRLDPMTRVGWAALVAGPVLLVLVVVFGGRLPGWVPLLGVFTLVGGFALLVSRLHPNDSDDDTDHHDGAVV